MKEAAQWVVVVAYTLLVEEPWESCPYQESVHNTIIAGNFAGLNFHGLSTLAFSQTGPDIQINAIYFIKDSLVLFSHLSKKH